jgi:hypothetical protein
MGFFKKLLGMHDIKVTGNMHVKTLKEKFKEEFGTEIRVYKSTNTGKGSRLADNDATLASVSDKKIEEITIKKSKTVGEIEDEFKEKLGLGIQIMNPDGKSFAPNDIKLKDIGK